MIPRIGLIAVALGLAALLLWHPARAPVVQSSAATPAPALPGFTTDPGARRQHRRTWPGEGGEALVVYVAGAVRRPGLYHLHAGDRNAQAVALAGGFATTADAGGVNLAQRANDGDEIYVPATGEVRHLRSSSRGSRRHALAPPPSAGVDVNRSSTLELAAVPGIGRAIAQRIVELREREGNFSSLDELLDVAGMTQTRLERARPYLLQP